MSMINMNTVRQVSLINGARYCNGSGLSSPNQSPNGLHNGANQHHTSNKGTIERGVSWGYNETRLLLSLWGHDMIQRQLTNSKRTKHVWEKIAEKIREHGFERTSEQVRTRVFNMIAEYRRILKNPTPERKKKCIFFDSLHRIYQAKDLHGVRAALNYDDDFSNYGDSNELHIAEDGQENGLSFENGDINESDNENEEVFAYHISPSQTLNHPTTFINGHNHVTNQDSSDHVHHEDPGSSRGCKRIKGEPQPNPFSSGLNCGLSPASYDGSYALLIDRVFQHFTSETEVMREWVKLEKERCHLDTLRRKDEQERQERRENAFLDAIKQLSEQTFNFLSNFVAERALSMSSQESNSSTSQMVHQPYSYDPSHQNLAAPYNMAPSYHSQ